REQLHHTGDGIGAIENTRRSAHDFDALDVVYRKPRKVNRSARIVHRYAVDQYADVVVLTAAQEDRRLRSGSPTPSDDDTRHESQQLGYIAGASALDERTVDNGGGTNAGP